jgi:hypothetical protein
VLQVVKERLLLLLLLPLLLVLMPAQFVLYESEVINEWLEEQFPQLPPLLPAHPLQRSKVRHKEEPAMVVNIKTHVTVISKPCTESVCWCWQRSQCQ